MLAEPSRYEARIAARDACAGGDPFPLHAADEVYGGGRITDAEAVDAGVGVVDVDAAMADQPPDVGDLTEAGKRAIRGRERHMARN